MKNEGEPLAREAHGGAGAEDLADVGVEELPVESLLELILAEHVSTTGEAPEAEPPSPARIDGVVIGRLAAIDAHGAPLVEHSGAGEASPARAMVTLGAADVGRDVALLFEGGDPGRPVVMGLMHAPSAPAPRPQVEGDGARLVFSAEKEIVLRCGEASITLTRAGKVLIRGAYLLTRSSGVNRIQGGSVQIN